MGLVASQARLLMLTAYKSDLEFKMEQISQKRLLLAATAINVMYNQDAQAVLQNLDKQLELQMKIYETQHKAVSTEFDSVSKIIDKNIEKSFKYVA
ncbi:MAG: hypothetical protein A2287_04595 [Candidatus Melainabacteria bacterium RIFOXYA12_FULL_32_12]|nr:MAG: hypothetical protein A2104_02280 [Candidatus Melainabacteria bacterium GWF2_32_7]OGI22618.1 MAG: hypothetical protein A2255_08895 [Candidatus Melainabacteria bacterium RIFOXYA2_FULL_32_9]OGI24483.1 MAG: hypothetical protein A2287_04595 [Candidatus Melainabacteria bacterium RIFOXYA12_FULL_32_12]